MNRRRQQARRPTAVNEDKGVLCSAYSRVRNARKGDEMGLKTGTNRKSDNGRLLSLIHSLPPTWVHLAHRGLAVPFPD